MKKVLCIVGPTAVGKTALSLFLAPHINGVIFSADSIQVYKGLDIISGKDKELYKDIPVRMLDVTSIEHSYNVSDYIKQFENEIRNISKDQAPIIVGGTGFYISALLDGIKTVNVKPISKLRKSLQEKNVQELQDTLQLKDSKRFFAMNNSDKNNPRRLIRAIEISESKVEGNKVESIFADYEVYLVGLYLEREKLNKKIDERVEQRIKDGALKEAKELCKSYKKLAPQIKRANGYKQLFEHLLGSTSLEEAIEKWKIAEHQNAKKQITYFKKMKNIHWLDVQEVSLEKILKCLEEWYNQTT